MQKNLPSLTGLRFIAAAMVLVHHSSNFAIIPAIRGWHGFGTTGVTFFFVLSGFILTWNLNDLSSVATFYMHRIFRIWPVMIATLIMALPVFGFNWQAIFLSVFALQAWSTDPAIYYGGNPVAWSLSNEAFFYLLFPVLVFLFQPMSKRSIFFVAAIVFATQIIVSRNSGYIFGENRAWGTYVFPVYRLMEFVIGMLAAFLVKSGSLKSSRFFNPYLFMAITAGWFALYYSFRPMVPQPLQIWIVAASSAALTLAYCLIITSAACADIDGTKQWVAHRWMVKLGEWSFSIYMTHSIIVYGLVWAIGKQSPSNLNIGWHLLILAVTTAVSALIYERIEAPANRWLRKWWMQGTRLSAPAIP